VPQIFGSAGKRDSSIQLPLFFLHLVAKQEAMKPYLFILTSLLLFSCTTPVEKKTDIKTEAYENSSVKKFDTDLLLGKYSGTFGKAMIVLQLNYIQGKNASGYNIVRGNRRNIKGTIEDRGKSFHFILKEPGDQEYDGVFEFDIDTAELVLNGKWTPNIPEKASEKYFKLTQLTANDSSSFIGYHMGNIDELYGSLDVKKNGTCAYIYSIEDPANPDGQWMEKKIMGTWLETDGKVTIEFEKNSYLPFYRMTLTRYDEEYGTTWKSGENIYFSKEYY
jgi:hypothetical protein